MVLGHYINPIGKVFVKISLIYSLEKYHLSIILFNHEYPLIIREKPLWRFLLIFTSTFLFSCSGEPLKDRCNCELSGQEVFLDYKGEYYWIEIDTESELKTFGPYSDPEHGYAAIDRCEELAKECD